ncbi:MAG: hypothetical protein KGL39_49035 [Patescibacteria group bacterium]|nr:hypothetical protein [Patescibacteria group bacterium]
MNAPSILAIQVETAAYFQISKHRMLQHFLARQYARPRQIAMYLCRELTVYSLPEIGKRFERDHTTVLHAFKTISALRDSDARVKLAIETIRERLLDREGNNEKQNHDRRT